MPVECDYFYYVIKICNDFTHYVITPRVSMADLPSSAETKVKVVCTGI